MGAEGKGALTSTDKERGVRNREGKKEVENW